MPVSMDWDNAQRTVIRVTFDGTWEIKDIHLIINKGVSMIESVDHDVDTIYDFTRSKFSPKHILTTVDYMENSHNIHERLMIMVNASVYIRSLTKVAAVMAPKTFADVRFVNCLEDAYALIAQVTEKALA